MTTEFSMEKFQLQKLLLWLILVACKLSIINYFIWYWIHNILSIDGCHIKLQFFRIKTANSVCRWKSARFKLPTMSDERNLVKISCENVWNLQFFHRFVRKFVLHVTHVTYLVIFQKKHFEKKIAIVIRSS